MSAPKRTFFVFSRTVLGAEEVKNFPTLKRAQAEFEKLKKKGVTLAFLVGGRFADAKSTG